MVPFSVVAGAGGSDISAGCRVTSLAAKWSPPVIGIFKMDLFYQRKTHQGLPKIDQMKQCRRNPSECNNLFQTY